MKHLLLIFCLLASACSGLENRQPASERNPLLDKILTVTSSKAPVDLGNHKDQTEQLLKNITSADLIEDLNMSAGDAFKVELEIDPKTYRMAYKIYYGASAFSDNEAVLALNNLLLNIIYSKSLRAALPFYEMYYNATRGHLQSLKNFLYLKNSRNALFPSRSNAYLETPGYAGRLEEDAKMISEIDRKLKEEKKLQTKASAIRKALLSELDKLPEDQQFRNVIARGDRSGAADLIKKYLPWELMAPFEKRYWETYLDVMENPAPLEERVIIYRGVDDDIMQVAAGFSKEQAEKESRAFFMSTLMTKNQGSWNRRLRSLESMYDKTIGKLQDGKEIASAARVTTIFSNHAGDPVGSPFLSFSPDLSVARTFGVHKVSAYLMDPRLLSYNFTGIAQESEFLVGLTTFPEDMIGLVVNGAREASPSENEEFFNKKLLARIEAEYGTAEASNIVNKIKKNSYNFFLSRFKPHVEGGEFLPEVVPGPSNLKFYNGLKKDALKPVLGPTGNLNCATMMQLFWK